MRRTVCLILAALSLAGGLRAQVRGSITLPDGEPATYATVMLFADSNTDGTPTAYDITDSKGRFNIKTGYTPGHWLTVRYLGYKEYRQELKGANKPLNIKLEADVKRLNAVKVEAAYKSVEVSGDTIKFNTEYFKTGAEDNAAEVLNKIPGMEVSDNGEVSYGGKKVDKITIDGKDMFSSGSDGALQTLSADAIQGAEILRNARSNSIIDNFSGRDLTTLNLKTDGRTRANGKVSALGGVVNRYKSENSLLVIGKKLSLTGILSGNNTGETVFSFNDYIQHIVGLENLLASNGKGFSFSEDELALLVPPSNVYASRNGVATLSGNWQPGDKFRMKGNLILNGNELDAESVSLQEYYSFGMTNLHSLRNNDRNRFFSGQLQETWKPRENVEFSNRTRLTRTGLTSEDDLTEQGLSNLNANEENNLSKLGLDEEMVLNVQLGDNLLSAHLSANSSDRNYSYDLLTDRMLLPANYYRWNGSGFGISNNRQIRNTQLAPDVTYALHLGHQFTLNTTLAYSIDATDFRYKPEMGSTVAADLTTNRMGATLTLNKNKGLFRFSLGTTLNRYHWKSNLDHINGLTDIKLSPEGSVTLAFNSTHRLSLSASMSQSPIELEYLLTQDIVRGYNSLYVGTYITKPLSESRNANLNYYIYDLFSNTLFYAVAGITDNRYSVRPNTFQGTSVASFTTYDNDGQTQSLYLNGMLTKGLGSWPVDARLNGMVTKTTSLTTVNTFDGNMEALNYSGSLSLVSRSKKVLNGEIGASYQATESRFESEITGGLIGLLGTMSSRLQQYGAHVALIVTTKQFNGEVRLTYTHLENGTYTREFLDLGFRMEYRLGRWRLLLRGSNMGHLRDMDWLSVNSTDTYLSSTTYRKIPGYIIAGLAYRF